MIKLSTILKSIILEGGRVFKDTEYDTANVDQGNIAATIEKFTQALGELFPGKKESFAALNDSKNWLGSTGRKQVPDKEGRITAGDIDLAYSGDNFISNDKVDLQGWGIDQEEYDKMYTAVASRARTATEEQMKVTALLRILVTKIEAKTSQTDLHVTGKATGGGALHFSFPQYNAEGEKLPQRAQIDLDTGNLDWLVFRNNAEITPEQEKEGIKRLHRGQLMLAMFSTAGYTFKSGIGLVSKETKQQLGKTPAEAVEVFNAEYKPNQPLTLQILSNYEDLVKYVEANMKGEDYATTMNTYLRQLEIPNEYIPAHMQKWKAEQEKR